MNYTMNSELSTVRIRNKEVPSDCAEIKESSTLESKSRLARKKQSSNETLICSIVILVCLTVIIYRSNTISLRILSGLTVIIIAIETES